MSVNRVKYYLTPEQREDIVFRRQQKEKQSDIARKYGISKQTVSAIEAKARKYGTTKDLPRSGRPRKTTRHEDFLIYHCIVKSPKKTPRMIKTALNLDISNRTITRRLKERGLKPCVAATVSYVSPANQKKRLSLAKKLEKKT